MGDFPFFFVSSVDVTKSKTNLVRRVYAGALRRLLMVGGMPFRSLMLWKMFDCVEIGHVILFVIIRFDFLSFYFTIQNY